MTDPSTPRKVCVVLVDRANYGRLKPVMRRIAEHPALQLQVMAAGTMVLERFQQPVQVVRDDGFTVDAEVYIELEGSKPVTMAKSVGFGIVEFASELQRLRPDFVLLIGDRYEALAAALAAAYMNIPLVHLQGGEVSGSIDESARHAITKFSQYHVPATRRSADYLVRLGEEPATILAVGCPGSDIARTLDRTLDARVVNERGSGALINTTQPYLLAVFHPTTTEFGNEQHQMTALLEALDTVRLPTLLLWPNIDAGSDHVSKVIRVFRATRQSEEWLRTRINMAPEDYLRVLAHASCAVGNSSSFVRDAGYFGTPVVLVGNRQRGREVDTHVTAVPCDAVAIQLAVEQQVTHGRYAASSLYGDGHVSTRLVEALAGAPAYVQKRLAYIDAGSKPS